MGSTLRGEVLGTGDADSHDQCEHWSQNDGGGLLQIAPSLSLYLLENRESC